MPPTWHTEQNGTTYATKMAHALHQNGTWNNANLTELRFKKNGTLRICVDFRKLNAATKKDHYRLPYLEEIIDEVVGHEMYSFLDCFSGYYQVAMAEQNKNKTAFTTLNGDGLYDVYTLGGLMKELWFARIRGILSQVYFRNNWNAIAPEQLCVLLMADKGEKIS